jgi:hypothetical protein
MNERMIQVLKNGCHLATQVRIGLPLDIPAVVME